MSLSVGASCVFRIGGLKRTDSYEEHTLDSGDLVIFGPSKPSGVPWRGEDHSGHNTAVHGLLREYITWARTLALVQEEPPRGSGALHIWRRSKSEMLKTIQDGKFWLVTQSGYQVTCNHFFRNTTRMMSDWSTPYSSASCRYDRLP